jgi:hypothetical protein
MTLLTWLKCTTDSPLSFKSAQAPIQCRQALGMTSETALPCSMSDAFAWETAACSSNEWLEGSGAIDSCLLCITAKKTVMRGAPRRGPCALFDSLHPPERGSRDAAPLEATRQQGVSRGGSHEAAADDCSRRRHSTERGASGRACSPAAAHSTDSIGPEAARSTKRRV